MARELVDDLELGEEVEERGVQVLGVLLPDLNQIEVAEDARGDETMPRGEERREHVGKPLGIEDHLRGGKRVRWR